MDAGTALGVSLAGGSLIYFCSTEILKRIARCKIRHTEPDLEEQNNMEDVVRRISDPKNPERYYKNPHP